MNTELILLGILLILSLPILGYNIKLVIIALLVFFLCYPEQREKILNNPIIKTTFQKIKDVNNSILPNKYMTLIGEGNSIIKDLDKLRLKQPLKGQLVSIHITWNSFVKLIKLVLDENNNKVYLHHHYDTLKDHRKNILNQLTGLIVGSSPGKDEKIRKIIKKVTNVIHQLMLLLEKRINDEWYRNPHNKISQIQWIGPQPYDKDDIEVF
jgi:hypothetical protein